MASFNRSIIAGNLCRDVELRYTPSGKAVARIDVAVNSKWKAESGDMKERCDFVSCDVWGRTAENLAQYCKKGSNILVEGRLQLDTWEKDGQKHSKLKVVAETIQFLGSPRDGDGSQPRQQRPAAAAPAADTGGGAPDGQDDDVPF